MTELGSRSVEMEEEDDDCCYAISEGSFVGVGELLCEAARSESERAARHEHRFKLIVAGESGVGKRCAAARHDASEKWRDCDAQG